MGPLAVSGHSQPLEVSFAGRCSRPCREVDQDTPHVTVVLLHACNNSAIVFSLSLLVSFLTCITSRLFSSCPCRWTTTSGNMSFSPPYAGSLSLFGMKAVTVIFDVDVVLGKMWFQIYR